MIHPLVLWRLSMVGSAEVRVARRRLAVVLECIVKERIERIERLCKDCCTDELNKIFNHDGLSAIYLIISQYLSC